MVAIHHVHNNLLAPTLWHDVASVLAGLPQHVGTTEDLVLTCFLDAQSTESLEPQFGAPSNPRQLRGGDLNWLRMLRTNLVSGLECCGPTLEFGDACRRCYWVGVKQNQCLEGKTQP